MTDPVTLKSVADAWEHFTTRLVEHIRVEDETDTVTEAAVTDDEALAAFIRKNEGVFEQHLIARANELPPSGRGSASALHALWQGIRSCGARSTTRGPLDATLAAFDPLKGLHLCRIVLWRHHDEKWADIVPWFFAHRLDRVPDRDEAPPELRDSIAFQRYRAAAPPEPGDSIVSRWSRTSGADAVPHDLDGMTPRDIEAMFEEYVGLPIGDIEARLRPDGSSFSGFLGPEDRLGEVVWEDAKRLRELRVDRRVLADRLEEAVERAYKKQVEAANRAPPGASWAERYGGGRPGGAPIELTVGDDNPVALQVWRAGYLGSQSNPFHTLEVESTNSDFIIVNPSLGTDRTLRGSMLASTLIRRFCFFEGRVPYRIEPELAARVLGLIA